MFNHAINYHYAFCVTCDINMHVYGVESSVIIWLRAEESRIINLVRQKAEPDNCKENVNAMNCKVNATGTQRGT